MVSPPSSSSSRKSVAEPIVPGSIADVLEWLRKAFRPERAEDLSVTYQFELSGESGGGLWVRVDAGRLEVAVGQTPEPDVVFRLPAEDLFGVLAGTRNPDLLFMERKIEIEGDLSLALKLRSLFNAGA